MIIPRYYPPVTLTPAAHELLRAVEARRPAPPDGPEEAIERPEPVDAARRRWVPNACNGIAYVHNIDEEPLPGDRWSRGLLNTLSR